MRVSLAHFVRMVYTTAMGVITDIKPQAKNKGRVSVYIDGKFYCGMEKLTALAFRLAVGGEVDEQKLQDAIFDSECTSAFERAAKYLGSRPRTRKEITDYLAQKGYTSRATERTVGKLTEYGYIDDEAYCRTYIEKYKHKAGARKLENDLLHKGVPRAVVDRQLQEIDDGQTAEAILALAQKYLRSHAPDRRTLTAYLLSKGFSYDAVKDALREIDLSDDTDEEYDGN